ncbi:MAG: response regulator [Thermoproteota archaeon]|nr:response regulator [Thermoproteota archaeon]
MVSVLIVDDEEDISYLLRQYLTQRGFDAVSFTSPLLAFEHFKHNPHTYPIVITDLRMPGMSGTELANKIRETNDTAKIFIVTAFDPMDLESKPGYRQAKIERVIQKPINLLQVKNIIKQALQIQ